LLAQPFQAKELAGQPFVTIDTNDYLGAILSNWLADAGQTPASAISVQTYPLAKSLVQARAGVALVDSFTANYPPDGADIQVRPLDIDASLTVYAVTQHAHPPSQSAERLIEFLREGPETADA
jgi:DNA-binding transcriptional LysR family regulator